MSHRTRRLTATLQIRHFVNPYPANVENMASS